MNIEAAFVKSAAGASDFPRDRLPEIALVGRSNVGKSSLINALLRQRIARTSAAPGKTRLANVYRVARGARPPFYLVDLPGYGFAHGGSAGFEELAHAYFRQVRLKADTTYDRVIGALLLVDSRHPGIERDRNAWAWLKEQVGDAAIVATKIDKLARGERIRAMSELESVYEHSVLPVSVVTGEGLDELWKLIDRLVNRSSSPRRSTPPRAMAALRPKK